MTTQGTWDPLAENFTPELASATIKRQIRNVLKSYTGWFDPFSELIQNALDAVEARRAAGDNFEGHIWITVDLRQNLISVTDNGVGLSEQQLRNFLAPNVSFKGGNTRGNKGVGATYLAYGFNHLHIATKSPGFDFSGTLKDGRRWVEDTAGVVDRPLVTPADAETEPAYRNIDRGTCFTLTLVGENVRPRKLDWLALTNAEQWATLLRLKTPLGGIYLDGKQAPAIKCTVATIDQAGNTSTTTIDICQYLYPHLVISNVQNLDEIRATQADYITKGKDPSKLPARFYKLNGLWNLWPTGAFADGGVFAGRLSEEQVALAKQYEMSCYGFFCYSTDLWDHFNDEVLRARKGERTLHGGVQLGTNHMPQGEPITIPLKRHIGYQNTSHVLIHFTGADPDLGRKGFQPELGELAKAAAVVITNSFLDWRSHLKQETGAPPDIVAKRNIHDWIKDQEAHEQKHPLAITRDDVFLPTKRASLTSIPLNEQDVVALFNQLLAGGVIRGVKLMSCSTYNQYDGICRFALAEPTEHHIFDTNTNPLGIESTQVAVFESAPSILEYKYSVDALIEEAEKDEKNETDIGLVVAWELGKHWEQRYSVTSLLDFDNVHHRQFHGATHVVRSAMTGIPLFTLVILRELIDYINNPAGVQDYHKARYSGQ